MAEERKSGEPPGFVPLIIGGPGRGGGGAGRHRSLQTLSLKGIPEAKHDGFVSSLQALGFRVTKSGGKLIVPAKDRSSVQGIIDIERLQTDEVAKRSDDRWWYGLVDAAGDLADATATHLRSGRTARSGRCAGLLFESARRLR